MPEPQEGRQRALLEGRDEWRRPCQLPFPAVHERHPSVGRLLKLLQDQTQRLLEQSRHQCRFEGRPEDRASAQHAQHIRGERAPSHGATSSAGGVSSSMTITAASPSSRCSR